MPDGGASQIFIDENYGIHALYNTGNAFPSTAFINHEIQVYDLMNNAGSWSINSRITDMLEECSSDCDPDPCSDVSEGDVNSDGIINIVDVIFIGVAYLVNKDNAKYLLAGYNTMSVEERKKFDLENFLIFWKKFFVILAFASTTIFVISYLMFTESVTLIIWTACLIIPWPIFLYKANKDFIK